jgi:histidine triad (HIT) family protein
VSDTRHDCIFCQIIAGEAEASVVYRDETCIAFMDLHAVNPGHALVVPLAHHEYLHQVPPDTAGQMIRVAQRIGRALRRSHGEGEIVCEGLNLFVADGRPAGQDVPHAHLHVIPRARDDGFGLRLPPDYGRAYSRRRLDATAERIREAMESQA